MAGNRSFIEGPRTLQCKRPARFELCEALPQGVLHNTEIRQRRAELFSLADMLHCLFQHSGRLADSGSGHMHPSVIDTAKRHLHSSAFNTPDERFFRHNSISATGPAS